MTPRNIEMKEREGLVIIPQRSSMIDFTMFYIYEKAGMYKREDKWE